MVICWGWWCLILFIKNSKNMEETHQQPMNVSKNKEKLYFIITTGLVDNYKFVFIKECTHPSPNASHWKVISNQIL